jgi:radical SAM protein with 4Fe4S-binding SPASM domain
LEKTFSDTATTARANALFNTEFYGSDNEHMTYGEQVDYNANSNQDLVPYACHLQGFEECVECTVMEVCRTFCPWERFVMQTSYVTLVVAKVTQPLNVGLLPRSFSSLTSSQTKRIVTLFSQ